MHVGYSAFFQNLSGEHTDADVWQHELSIVDKVEAAGFDSVWAPEHHFTNYVMCPDTTQFLTWVAARTERVQLGAMISVLPWHDPVRLAEEWSMLDHCSGGRAILGLGRGLGRVEFERFRVDMSESRGRFTEYAAAILGALETGYIESDGEHYRQPRAAIRPFPSRSFRGRAYASAVSPESMDLMARLGVGVLVIAQKPWKTTIAELDAYRARFVELNGDEPPRPIIAVFCAVGESADHAEELHEHYLMAYAESALDHYQFDDAGIAEIPGYEYYAGLSANIDKHGRRAFAAFLADLQVWGDPGQVTEQLIEYQRMIGAGAVVGVFSYGGMPFAEVDAGLDRFTTHCLPALAAHPVEGGLPAAGDRRTEVGATTSPTRVRW